MGESENQVGRPQLEPRPCWGILHPRCGLPEGKQQQVTPSAPQTLGHPCRGPAGMTGNQGPDDLAGREEGHDWGWNWSCPTFGPPLYPFSGQVRAQEEEGQPTDGTSASSQVTLSLLAATAKDTGWFWRKEAGEWSTGTVSPGAGSTGTGCEPAAGPAIAVQLTAIGSCLDSNLLDLPLTGRT